MASQNRVTVWVDEDDDDFPDAGETVTWFIGTDGNLWRWTDTEDEQIHVSNLVYAESGFGFDDPDPALVSSITITLTAALSPAAEGQEPGQRRITTQIHLRNR